LSRGFQDEVRTFRAHGLGGALRDVLPAEPTGVRVQYGDDGLALTLAAGDGDEGAE
jgi:hypothetical protein